MVVMTSKTPTWDAALHPRETAGTGKFDFKPQTEPELVLGADWDMDSFMQEPTAHELDWVRTFAPVIVTLDGGSTAEGTYLYKDERGRAVVGPRGNAAWADGDIDPTGDPVDFDRIAPDASVHPSAVEAEHQAVLAAAEVATNAVAMTDVQARGLDRYRASLAAKDSLTSAMHASALEEYEEACRHVNAAFDDAVRRELIHDTVEDAIEGTGVPHLPDLAFQSKSWDGDDVVREAQRAAVVAALADGGMLSPDDGKVQRVRDVLDEAAELGANIELSSKAAKKFHAKASKVSQREIAEATTRIPAFSARDAKAFTDIADKLEDAAETLSDEGVLSHEADLRSAAYTRESGGQMLLAASRAAQLRDLRELTNVTEKELDRLAVLVSRAFDRKVTA